MPLYSDPGYFYGGSSSYSPYYTSNPYASYAGYSRALAGTYVVPTSRTTHLTSSSSRYKPKLTPISELPLSSRGLTSLTRIQSPKISYHSVTPKYIPSRPININAADIDVSASRYPKHEHYFPPIVTTNSTPKDTSSDLNNNSSNVKPSESSDFMPRIDGTDPHNRSTIKRNRAVVRLSIMRSKSKEKIPSDSSKPKDAPATTSYVPVQDTTNSEKPQKSSWRDNFGEDLIPKAKDFTRKTPGELLMERHLIRDKQKEENALKFTDLSKVSLDSDALLNVDTIRRLSLSKCPSFHEICADISSDKIDDDLNAGELRRRASLIQEQEIEILNELQKSGSGLIQYILERNESQDDCRKSTKRKSKRGKKIRHKITATVDIDDGSPPPVTPILEEPSPTKPCPPKLVFSVDAVAEDHTINTVLTLPKIKKTKSNAEGVEKIEELKIDQKVVVESEKIEKMPKLIVKSDSVVNVTLEINRKVVPKTTGAETKIVAKKSPEKQIVETSTKTFAKSLSPEKKPIEEHAGKKLSPEKKAAKPKKKLSPEKKIIQIEIRRLSPEKKTTLNKETKKDTLEVKSGMETERSKSLPPEVSKNVETIASRKSLDDQKESEKIESSKISEVKTNKTEIGKIGDQVQFAKPSDQPKSVSKMKELFGNDQKTSSKIAEEKAKIKALSPEKKTEIGKIGEPKSDQPKSVSKMKELFASDQRLSVKNSKRDEKKEMLAVKEADKLESPKGKELSPEKKSLAQIFEERAAKKAVPAKVGVDLPVAKPKPIIKLQRSDSGEDFWGQIGSRETLYMDKRKQNVVENQWEKREHLLEDRDLQNANDAKSIQTIKDKLSTQKTEALKEAADLSSTKKDVRRSVSNASALTKPETKKLVLTSKSTAETKEKPSIDQSAVKPSTKSNNIDVKATCDKKISPDSVPLKIDQTTTTKTTSTTQKENIIIESPIQSAPGRSTSAETKSSPPIPSTLPQNATATAASTTTDRSAPKINVGLTAKSPETKIKQTSSGQNDHTPTEDKYKDLTNLSKETKTTTTTAAAAQPTTLLATTPKPSTAITPAKKGDQPKCSALIESGRVAATAAATAKKDTGPKAQPAGTPPPQSPQLSTIQTNSNGGQHDNDKISTIAATGSRKENKKTQQSGSKISPHQRSNEQRAAVTPTTILPNRDVDAAVKTDRRNENVATKIGTDAAGVVVATTGVINALTKPIETAPEPTTPKSTEDDKSRSDSNLNSNSKSKFAPVSNLSRCLIDVDADLSDYYPSDPFSSSDEDVNTSECSSCNGDSNYYSRSMKKKAKHTHHNQQKKKDKEAKKFDPNKKIKLDHTKKCYVKEEAPPYPLIATPRPLWKREKFNLPESSSDSEETESDSECSSSDECSGDDLTSTAKNAVAATPDTSDIRMSTCSNDSGFEGGTAPTSPKKMLETSYTFAQFQRSGRITAPATIIPRFKKYSVDDFHFLAVLGKGSFGKVLLAELRNTDYCYAVKCLKKDVVLEDDDVECTLIERKVLALGTKHPYLCHLFCTFQTESHLFFVMEYLNGGDLMFHIQQSGRFPEPRARFYAAEIISGLKFLHKKGIIYRDLKLDNVLLDFDGHVRIADFGMCKLQIYLDKTADSFCGTPDYMAPEIIKGDKYNQNVDWWSFGVLLYEMLIGQSPFSGCDEDELFWSICNEIPWFPIFITKEGISILKGLLEKDSNIRLGSQYSPAGDICDHPFFREIDWNRLDRRAIDPPFKPQVKHPLDTKYFDKTFTRERVRLTPIDKEILQSMDQVQFEGFSYTNPNATLN